MLQTHYICAFLACAAFLCAAETIAQGTATVTGAPAASMVRDGDRWVCLGDSITAFNCYPPLLARVFAHYHPGAALTVINSGQGGDTASPAPEKLEARVLKHKPAIVSIMYGMNEAINAWQPGRDKTAIQEGYRAALTSMARTMKAQGITVLLMSPSPTDPATHSYYNLDKTVGFLRECADIVREVAKAEGVYYVPVQEEFMAFQEALPRNVVLAPDGVHPAALGQYCIARSLWQFAGMDRPLGTGARAAPTRTPDAQVTAALAARFIRTDAAGVELTLSASAPVAVSASWSYARKCPHSPGQAAVYADGLLRGQETLKLAAGKNSWTIPVPPDQLPATPGQAADIVVDLRAGDSDSLFIVDLCRTRVLHLVDNKVSGLVETDEERPEGKVVAKWQAERLGDSLLLSFEVFDKDIVPDGVFPFTRDGLNLMLDFRPSERFADIGVDREVTQTFLNVRERPFFSVGLRAWTGLGMDYAAAAAGARTAAGYTVQMLINENFDLHTPVRLSQRDFVGLLVAVAEHATVKGASRLVITTNQKNDTPVYLYANNLMILDLKNRLPGDEVINAHLTPGGVRRP